jgi:DNA-binding GntR family transcriptional regulator
VDREPRAARSYRIREPEMEADILAAAHRLRGCPEGDGDSLSDDWYRENRAFHDTLVSACNSPLIMTFRAQLYDLSDRYRRVSVRNGLAGRDFDAEHQLITDAVLARDVDAAVAHTVNHFVETTHAILIGELKSRHEVQRIIAAMCDEIRSGMGAGTMTRACTKKGPRRKSRKK